MIATFSTSSYGRLPLFLHLPMDDCHFGYKTRIPKKEILMLIINGKKKKLGLSLDFIKNSCTCFSHGFKFMTS